MIVREHAAYTGAKADRAVHTSEAGTVVNSAYYGRGEPIEALERALERAHVLITALERRPLPLATALSAASLFRESPHFHGRHCHG